jgi:hypothetical protein
MKISDEFTQHSCSTIQKIKFFNSFTKQLVRHTTRIALLSQNAKIMVMKMKLLVEFFFALEFSFFLDNEFTSNRTSFIRNSLLEGSVSHRQRIGFASSNGNVFLKSLCKLQKGWSTWCTDDIIECYDDFCNEDEIKGQQNCF